MSTTAIPKTSILDRWEVYDPNATGTVLIGRGDWFTTETEIPESKGLRIENLRFAGPSTEAQPEASPESVGTIGWLEHSLEFLRDICSLNRPTVNTPGAFSNYLARAFLAAGDEAESVTPLRLRDVELWLSLLADAPSDQQNSLRKAILRASRPESILAAALQRYEHTGRQRYLDMAVSLLEDFGDASWMALRTLALSGRAECEMFVRLISDCAGVSDAERAWAFKELAHSPHVEVRAALFEYLFQLSESGRRDVLRILAGDDDSSIRDEAEERLDELH